MSRPSSLARRCNSRFHETHARAVAAAAVGGDYKSRGSWVSGTADFSPPAADRLNRERRCVMIHADADPTGVVGQIVDAIGDRPAQFLDQEVVHPNVLRLTCGTPFPTGVLEVSDEFLLLRIDRDHRFARGQRRSHGVVDVNELRIAIGMAVAFPGLAIGLQAELLLVQQTRRPPCGRPGGLSPPKPPPTATGFCKSSAAATSDRRASLGSTSASKSARRVASFFTSGW